MPLSSLVHQILLLIIMAVPALNAAAEQDPPFSLPAQSELDKLRSAIIFTNKGDIHLELFPEEAPWHVANLKYLADKGFYKNTKFHLYYENYLIQGGDPKGDGTGGPGYSLPAEFGSRNHSGGILGMARLKDSRNPERRSNGSQFHILMIDAPRMDGEYSIFGRDTEGMNVVKKLRKGDRIEDLIVFVRK